MATARPFLYQFLAEGLVALSVEMAPREVRTTSTAAATIIVEAVAANRCHSWPLMLRSLAEGIDPNDAARLFATAMRADLSRFAASDSSDRIGTQFSDIFIDIVPALAYVDSDSAADAAWQAAKIHCSCGTPPGPSKFNDLLSDVHPRTTADSGNKAPQGCRLSTPQLVELLKMPTCFGDARRVILDHLERRYDRRFNTVWSFVRFAEEQELGVDFTTPPVRPDPAKMKPSAP